MKNDPNDFETSYSLLLHMVERKTLFWLDAGVSHCIQSNTDSWGHKTRTKSPKGWRAEEYIINHQQERMFVRWNSRSIFSVQFFTNYSEFSLGDSVSSFLFVYLFLFIKKPSLCTSSKFFCCMSVKLFKSITVQNIVTKQFTLIMNFYLMKKLFQYFLFKIDVFGCFKCNFIKLPICRCMACLHCKCNNVLLYFCERKSI